MTTSTPPAPAPTVPARLDRTVNFHFIQNCNLGCNYCFATFQDEQSVARGDRLPDEELFRLTRLLAKRYTKVTFAGGEPTIYKRLPELLTSAREEGTLTNLVTNGFLINAEWLGVNAANLDLLTVSVDSDNPDTQRALGRAVNGKRTASAEGYLALAEGARAAGIRFKVNTVVTTINQREDISGFIRALAPERWKVLQAAPVEGQNDKFIGALTPEHADFDDYVARHEAALSGSGIRVVAEPIDVIRGSYIMVDPRGRFFDSTSGHHQYSEPILDAGHDSAFAEVSFDVDKFYSRGGDADFAPHTQ